MQGEGNNVKIADSEFLAIPYKGIYKCIVGRPFMASLDVVGTLIHLKLKFHNIHSEIVTVNVDLT